MGIAGVPGSGKSTVAAQVVALIQQRLGTTPEDNPAVAISMDGARASSKGTMDIPAVVPFLGNMPLGGLDAQPMPAGAPRLQ